MRWKWDQYQVNSKCRQIFTSHLFMTKSGELVTHSSPSEPSIMQFKVVNPRFMGFVLLQVGGPNGPVPWHVFKIGANQSQGLFVRTKQHKWRNGPCNGKMWDMSERDRAFFGEIVNHALQGPTTTRIRTRRDYAGYHRASGVDFPQLIPLGTGFSWLFPTCFLSFSEILSQR